MTYQEYPRALYNLAGDIILVFSDDERADREAKGWYVSRDAAKAAFERTQERIANAAAERAKSDHRLSPKARAEKLAQERATDQHVPE